MKKILVMGLPGSGKTTLVNELAPMLQAVVFNNDGIRKNISPDLGFSMQDRLTQAGRMGWLCNQVAKAGHYAIADFICPTRATRDIFGDCFMVFLDTIRTSHFPDTDAIFEAPGNPDVHFRYWDRPRDMASVVRNRLIRTTPKSMFIGRYQPLHTGHVALIRSVLDEGMQVVVALRDTRMDGNNPYTIADRKAMFLKEFGDTIEVIVIPDIAEVCYGRKVGWGIREIRLPEEVEAISATQIRKCGPK